MLAFLVVAISPFNLRAFGLRTLGELLLRPWFGKDLLSRKLSQIFTSRIQNRMSTSINAPGAGTISADDRGFFGHPRGLSTLFFTEMWERFSYYGMRALLTLYMTTKVVDGGLGFDEKYSSVVYATYVSSVWYLPLIGGWLADKFLGARRAVLIGGIIIACGHYSMAISSLPSFYGGLILIACGTGLLKPNISAMVGQLYKQGDERRDAGFSIFYTGINLGAFFSPIVTGFLAQHRLFKGVIASVGLNPNNSWHWGFGAAGVGMTLGLIQYVVGRRRLSHVGQKPEKLPARKDGTRSE